MTASVPTAPTRLGQALDDYRARISPDDHARLRKFVTWLGVSVTVEAVQAYKIEEFLVKGIHKLKWTGKDKFQKPIVLRSEL
jgi:hypothetical protein